MEADQNLSTEEVADLLGVTPRTVLNRVYRGELQSAGRFGRKAYIFLRPHVDQYLATKQALALEACPNSDS